MKRNISIVQVTIILVMVALLSSCGSSRRTVTRARQGTAAEVVTMAYTNDIGKKLVKEAKNWLGVPYRYGGHQRSGADCSGLVMEVYNRALGISLPRSSAEQCSFSTGINRKDLRHGDLIFFATGSGGRVSHVGIYIGDNRMIHSSSSRGVVVSDLSDKYWMRNYVAAGRILRDARNNSSSKGTSSRSSRQDDPIYTPVPPAGSLPPVTPPADLEVPTVTDYNVLDEILNQKLDSVYSNYLD